MDLCYTFPLYNRSVSQINTILRRSMRSSDFSIPSTVICSNTPWNVCPPVPRFGHRNPLKLSLAPSVPTGRWHDRCNTSILNRCSGSPLHFLVSFYYKKCQMYIGECRQFMGFYFVHYFRRNLWLFFAKMQVFHFFMCCMFPFDSLSVLLFLIL